MNFFRNSFEVIARCKALRDEGRESAGVFRFRKIPAVWGAFYRVETKPEDAPCFGELPITYMIVLPAQKALRISDAKIREVLRLMVSVCGTPSDFEFSRNGTTDDLYQQEIEAAEFEALAEVLDVPLN